MEGEFSSSSSTVPNTAATADDTSIPFLSSFWTIYTSEESWLPFLLPLLFWFSCWCYCQHVQKDFAKFYNLHTVHHVGAISCATLSLYFQDNTIFNERIGILFTLSYFLIDILHCLIMQHFTYILHGVICFGLGLCNYNLPLLRELRMNSKASYIETSSIILYQVKQNRNPTLFAIFALVYTLCRIVWIPMIYRELYHHGLEWYDPILIVLALFYGLQIHWWIKIIQIIIYGARDDNDATKKKHKKVNDKNNMNEPSKNKSE